jgi:hypothetical protein
MSRKKPGAITLAEIGIDKNLAHQARKFAALPEEKFEALVESLKRHLGISAVGSSLFGRLKYTSMRPERCRRSMVGELQRHFAGRHA